MTVDETQSGLTAITKREHSSDASAKRVTIRGQDPNTGNWVNIAANDNGDGTFSLKTTATIVGGGDASAANQTSGNQKTQIVDAGGEAATVTGGKLDVNASVSTVGLATSDIQTDGTQKSQIVDAGGDAVTVTGGKLDVNASIDTTGLATSAKQDTGNTSLSSIDGKITAVNTGAVTISAALPAGTNAIGKLAANSGVTIGAVELAASQTLGTVTNLAQLGGTAVAMNTGTRSAGTQRVTIATDDVVPVSQSGTWTVQPGNTANTTAWLTKEQASTAAVTSVASSATSVSLLSSAATRRAATFYNDSTQILYLKFGTTASTSSYTIQIAAGGYYEVPQPCYTGAIDGIWSSANGNVRITEIIT